MFDSCAHMVTVGVKGLKRAADRDVGSRGASLRDLGVDVADSPGAVQNGPVHGASGAGPEPRR